MVQQVLRCCLLITSALSQLKIRVRRTSSPLTNSGTDGLDVHRTGFNSTLILSCDKALGRMYVSRLSHESAPSYDQAGNERPWYDCDSDCAVWAGVQAEWFGRPAC